MSSLFEWMVCWFVVVLKQFWQENVCMLSGLYSTQKRYLNLKSFKRRLQYLKPIYKFTTSAYMHSILALFTLCVLYKAVWTLYSSIYSTSSINIQSVYICMKTAGEKKWENTKKNVTTIKVIKWNSERATTTSKLSKFEMMKKSNEFCNK